MPTGTFSYTIPRMSKTCQHCDRNMDITRPATTRFCSESCQRKHAYHRSREAVADKLKLAALEQRYIPPPPEPEQPRLTRAPTLADASRMGVSAAHTAAIRTESLTGAAPPASYTTRRADSCP